MSTIYDDIAQRFDFVFRAANDATLKLIALNPNGSNFDFTGYTVEYVVYRGAGGSIVKIYAAVISGNEVVVSFTETDNAKANTYVYEWKFTKNSNTVTWFAGKHTVIVGNPKNTTNTGNEITATINLTTSTITATVSQYIKLPYTAYSALISQTGTSAPTGTVLNNTVIGVLTWSRLSVGKYKLSIPGGFVTAKTLISVPMGAALYLAPNYLTITFDIDNNLLFETKDAAVEYADGILSNFNFELKVFA